MNTSRALTQEETDAFGRELDALRDEVTRDLGARDVAHIRAVIRLRRYTEAGGRLLLHFGIDPVTFALGTAALATAKVLDNMEVGHNIMHGQYDWTGDPALLGNAHDWDNVCAAVDWRHSHNYEHHTFTNILGRDRDVGYGFLRVAPEQPWNASHTVQPISAAVLAMFFQWGVAIHDLRLDETIAGTQSWRAFFTRARPFARKAARQLAKDYLLFPALALGNAPRVALGNLAANGLRNLWTFAIIFCGHFPDGVRVYREDEVANEGRGAWYLRQLNGSANIEGGRAFHVLSGHLSHQIEHHLFPDLPAARYPEMAPRVRAICERYGQAYNTGGFREQLGSVARRLFTYARSDRGATPPAPAASRPRAKRSRPREAPLSAAA